MLCKKLSFFIFLQEKSCQLFFNPINVKTDKQIGSIFCVNSNDPSLKTVNVLKKLKFFWKYFGEKRKFSKICYFYFFKMYERLEENQKQKAKIMSRKMAPKRLLIQWFSVLIIYTHLCPFGKSKFNLYKA